MADTVADAIGALPPALHDVIINWSLEDLLNDGLYRDKLFSHHSNTYDSLEAWAERYIWFIAEEVRAQAYDGLEIDSGSDFPTLSWTQITSLTEFRAREQKSTFKIKIDPQNGEIQDVLPRHTIFLMARLPTDIQYNRVETLRQGVFDGEIAYAMCVVHEVKGGSATIIARFHTDLRKDQILKSTWQLAYVGDVGVEYTKWNEIRGILVQKSFPRVMRNTTEAAHLDRTNHLYKQMFCGSVYDDISERLRQMEFSEGETGVGAEFVGDEDVLHWAPETYEPAPGDNDYVALSKQIRKLVKSYCEVRGLNPSQEVCVMHTLSGLPNCDGGLAGIRRQDSVLCRSGEPMKLVQGPPGTGKTTTIMSVISTVTAVLPKRQVLVTGPSNACVRELSNRFYQMCSYSLNARMAAVQRDLLGPLQRFQPIEALMSRTPRECQQFASYLPEDMRERLKSEPVFPAEFLLTGRQERLKVDEKLSKLLRSARTERLPDVIKRWRLNFPKFIRFFNGVFVDYRDYLLTRLSEFHGRPNARNLSEYQDLAEGVLAETENVKDIGEFFLTRVASSAVDLLELHKDLLLMIPRGLYYLRGENPRRTTESTDEESFLRFLQLRHRLDLAHNLEGVFDSSTPNQPKLKYIICTRFLHRLYRSMQKPEAVEQSWRTKFRAQSGPLRQLGFNDQELEACASTLLFVEVEPNNESLNPSYASNDPQEMKHYLLLLATMWKQKRRFFEGEASNRETEECIKASFDILKDMDEEDEPDLVSVYNPRYELDQKLVANARVICGTIGSTCRMRIPKMHLDLAIIDEACQMTESEMVNVIKHGPRQITMVGDPYQLQATVISRFAKRHNYGVSLMERLFNLKSRVYMLDEQFRMHPDINAWPSNRFYRGMVKNGSSVQQPEMSQLASLLGLPSLAFSKQPFIVVDVSSEEASGKSKSNFMEAEVAIAFAQFIMNKHRELVQLRQWRQELVALGRSADADGRWAISEEDAYVDPATQAAEEDAANLSGIPDKLTMAIITPYRSQAALLEERLKSEKSVFARAEALVKHIKDVDFKRLKGEVVETARRRASAEGVQEPASPASAFKITPGSLQFYGSDLDVLETQYVYKPTLAPYQSNQLKALIGYQSRGVAFEEDDLARTGSTSTPRGFRQEIGSEAYLADRFKRVRASNTMLHTASADVLTTHHRDIENLSSLQVRRKPKTIFVLEQRDVSELRVSTVDGFQGQEVDVTIFSAVRANGQMEIGHVADANRLNVAMTRSRKLLIVLVNAKTFGGSRSSDWIDLIKVARRNGVLLPMTAFPFLRDAVVFGDARTQLHMAR